MNVEVQSKYKAHGTVITNVLVGGLGICSKKNMTSTMIVNVLDVSLGGMVFWAFGYAIIFGDHPYSTPFYGVGKYFFSPDVNELGAGEHYLKFALMTAYVSAATTIPSGAMLERFVPLKVFPNLYNNFSSN